MNYKPYCKIGAVFTILFGTLLHFAYDLLGEKDFVAIFSAVNESTWEHLKLLYFPIMIFAIIEYFLYGKDTQNFWAVKTISVLCAMLSVIIPFYTYTGVIGNNFAVIDISIFIFAVILAYWLSYKLFSLNILENKKINRFFIIVSFVLFVIFWVYTFYPPLINLFKDPINGGFGI